VPQGERTTLDDAVSRALDRYRQAMDAHLLHSGAAMAMELADAANAFVEERAPWAQAKDPAAAADLDATLASLIRGVAALSSLLEPFMPSTMRQLAERLGLPAPLALESLATLDAAGLRVHRGGILFPKERPEASA
jgi:methionyl-tRNA synthetase